MKQTENMGLYLFEGKDPFNYEWLNENAQSLDWAIRNFRSSIVVWSKVPLNELPTCELPDFGTVHEMVRGQWIPYYFEGEDHRHYVNQGNMITDGKYVGQIVTSEGEPFEPDMLFIKNIELLGNVGNGGESVKLYKHTIRLSGGWWISNFYGEIYIELLNNRAEPFEIKDNEPDGAEGFFGNPFTAEDFPFLPRGEVILARGYVDLQEPGYSTPWVLNVISVENWNDEYLCVAGYVNYYSGDTSTIPYDFDYNEGYAEAVVWIPYGDIEHASDSVKGVI